MKKTIIIGSVAVVLILSAYFILKSLNIFPLKLNVKPQNVNNNKFQSQNMQGSNFEFLATPCDQNLTQAVIIGTYPLESQKLTAIQQIKEISGVDIKPITPGVQGYKWLDNNTVQATAIILINCADEVKGGDYSIESNKLKLTYELSKPTSRAECRCGRELNYKIKNIEKKDYQIELQAQ